MGNGGYHGFVAGWLVGWSVELKVLGWQFAHRFMASEGWKRGHRLFNGSAGGVVLRNSLIIRGGGSLVSVLEFLPVFFRPSQDYLGSAV